MDTYKPAEPRWDARLILPQELWPPKSASYTVSDVLASATFSTLLISTIAILASCFLYKLTGNNSHSHLNKLVLTH